MLGHLTQFRYLTRAPVYHLSRFFQQGLRAPFQFAAVPTPTETTLKQNHRSTDSGLFYASSQVTSLTLSTPPYPRENNNKLKTMCPLRDLFWGEDWGGQPLRGTGQFWRGNGGHFGVDMAWNWINKWRNPLFVAWVQQSQRMARGVATMRDPSKPSQTSFSLKP